MNISRRSKSVFYKFPCREVCTEALLSSREEGTPTQIGGPNLTVEVDEAKFGKRKYHRGRVVEGQWVLGGICRETRDCFLVPVQDRGADTLLSIIRERVAPGTTVLTDEESLATAVEKVKEAYPEQDSDIKDVHVSFDGSWHKRGHTSKIGLGLAIERKHYEVLTSYCPVCATTGKRLQQQNILRYERWLASHKPHCSANYEGPSGGMEKEAAENLE
ncbi:hypothetical protein EGW08_007742 [Elysia chlorotica]|uniref:ISXO2-like transposase domain-containing protein n=1 Tax=Elysia chlorotica TaxID=188477 RepID=A0A3S1A7D7_ELYCH|nr:hypothetical protein EGW08_007742 [Elysia chlorotica]